jgi:transposase-like protein
METPKTLQQAIVHFSKPENCNAFMIGMRWPDGKVRCPTCDSEKVTYLEKARLFKCYEKHPRQKFSLKVGTIFEDSPLGLDTWLTAIWLSANAKNGISSYEMSRSLGISQKSAWHVLHRIRLAMQNGSINKLSGTVEADETVIGGIRRFQHRNKRKAGYEGKVLVMGMLERHGEVRTKVIANPQVATIQRELREHVEHGSELMTDAYVAYTGLEAEYIHQFVNHTNEYVRGRVHTNGIENFWSLLKRSLKGTYISVEPFHLFRYLDEQAFRFNKRKGTDADRFLAVVSLITGKRLEYKKLIGQPSC